MKDPILFRSRLFWFLLAAAIIATRHLGDLVVPQLRDEDGLVYFQQALAWGGWRMILWPYGGYLNVLPRFFAALLRPIPLEWAPLAYNFSALIVVAATRRAGGHGWHPAHGRGRRRARSDRRAGNSVGCINLDMLHFTLAALIAVNLLESAPRVELRTIRRGMEVLVAALSGPEGIVLTPFTLLRAWQWRAVLARPF